MKLTRVVFVCTVLLLVAAPSFALPPCATCADINTPPCIQDPGSGTRCRSTATSCTETGGACLSFAGTPMFAEWTVASIEVTHPAQNAKVVAAPAVVARAERLEPALQK